MRLHYDTETDSLYIDLSEHPGTDAREVEPGIVLDFDSEGWLAGIDFQHASTFVDLSQLKVEDLPANSDEQIFDNVNSGD